ncbi:GIY-YIG nuclease family protein [Jiulongibacter sediminis]|uniref:GIY-YIG nuclease family protein n=1 Tax=Jiulongibacter sediminis TaxID=1605367 RepID=UPI0026EFF802|nr:GIY-YIG nuclease family protein [Jiulongibacter sediminis]
MVVYILRSPKTSDLYVGQTNDFDERLKRHNAGYVFSTRKNRPWKPECLIKKDTRSEAMKLEKYLKSLSRERKEDFIQKYGIQTTQGTKKD